MLPDLSELFGQERRDAEATVHAAITGTVVLAHPAADVEPTQGVALVIDENLEWGRVYLVSGADLLKNRAMQAAIGTAP